MNFCSVTSDGERLLITFRRGDTLTAYQAEFERELHLARHFTGHLELPSALIEEAGDAVRCWLGDEAIGNLFYRKVA